MELQEFPACSDKGSRVPVSVVGVDSGSAETPRKVEKGDGQLAPLEAISLLHGSTTVTHSMGESTDGRKGSFGGCVSRVDVVGSGTRGEPMFTSRHLFSIFATGVVGGC